jgi:predicted nucleic acid-binding protein
VTTGYVLDSGALIALESTSAQRRLLSILEPLGQTGPVIVSAGSVAEVWRGSARQVALAKLLRRRSVHVVDITAIVAKAIGVMLGHCTKADDIVDAHVALLARSHGFPAITSDPTDLLALDPSLPVVTI